MDTTTITILVIAVIVVVIAAAAITAYVRRRHTHELKSKFGPEYLRAVDETGSRKEAESRLQRREQRVRSYAIHPLAGEERTRFNDQWRKVQADFVDSPKAAISEADGLLGEVMRAKGYPVGDFERQSADLSVDHPVVVQEYRAAHDVAIRHARGETNTEDLRQAMIHYRALFDELANDDARTETKAAG